VDGIFRSVCWLSFGLEIWNLTLRRQCRPWNVDAEAEAHVQGSLEVRSRACLRLVGVFDSLELSLKIVFAHHPE
jgi:hypothetical protein